MACLLNRFRVTEKEIGVRTYLALVETPRVRTPSLFGWIRPRLLLPPGVLGRLRRSQLRHVLLHELAHLKRHDIALNWLMALLQALHWYNPFVWLAFRHARADREQACDELALSRLEGHESAEYGHTILDLLTTVAEARSVPTLAAIAEDVHQVKRRIQMIASFRRLPPTSRLVPVATMLLLGAVFLVDARSVVRGMISRDEFVKICRGQLAAVKTECGALVSRRVASVEYMADLPLGLGPGISVRYASTYQKKCALRGPQLLFAKDTDGVWRLVRGDQE